MSTVLNQSCVLNQPWRAGAALLLSVAGVALLVEVAGVDSLRGRVLLAVAAAVTLVPLSLLLIRRDRGGAARSQAATATDDSALTHAALQLNPDFCGVIGSDNALLYVNHPDLASLVGLDVIELVVPEDRPLLQSALDSARELPTVSELELTGQAPGMEPILIRCRIKSIPEGDRVLVAAAPVKVAHRASYSPEMKGGSVALRRAESDLVLRVDQRGAILDSKTAPGGTGLDLPEDRSGDQLTDILGPQAASHLRAAIRTSIRENCPSTRELRTGSRGDERVMEARVAPVSGGEALVLLRDVTALQRATEMAVAAQFALDCAMDQVLWIRGDNSIAYVNETACRFHRKDHQRLLESKIDDLGPCFCAPDLEDVWLEAAAMGHTERNVVLVGADSKRIDAHLTAALTWLGSEQVLCCTLRDVTERREADERLLQAERIEAVGQLAGGVAHDFNNMLLIVSSCADFIRDLPLPEAALEDVNEIIDTCDRAAGLVGQLMAFSRKRPLEECSIEVGSELERLQKLLKRVLGEDIEVVLAIPGRLRPLWIDPCVIEQIVVNLAVNARDAMPRGGRLTVSLSRLRVDESDSSDDLKPAEYAVISVADTGHGMNEQLARNCFEPFFTTKADGKGTGLGLASAMALARRIEGTIRVKSEEGMGTVFSVYLPYRDPPVKPDADSDYDEGGDKEGTILLIEDHVAVRSVISRTLRSLGYEVLEASGYSEASFWASKRSADIQVIVTDVVMPRMNGPEVIERLQPRLPNAATLYISGFGDHAALQALSDTQVMVLQKPFSRKRLAKAVRKASASRPGGTGQEGGCVALTGQPVR